MPIDAEHLRQHYASLSDEELIELDRNDLTEVAQKCYDREIERRGLSTDESDSIDEDKAAMDRWVEAGDDVEDETSDEDEEPFVACAFSDYRGGSSAADAAEAHAALQAAGIPSRIEVVEVEPEPVNPVPRTEYQVIVPSGLSLQATSVLDKEIFNPKNEADWKTHFEALTDEQLLRLNADAICAGYLDRAARLKKAYNDEVRRRKIS
jgi:hypothetical protein